MDQPRPDRQPDQRPDRGPERRLDLNLLATLDVLLAERNVTRAARRLNLSQPAVSAQLARLRDLLGDPLLLPERRGMVPTPRALALAPDLHAALERVRAIASAGTRFDPTVAKGTIAIAASDYGHRAVTVPFEAGLAEWAPGLRLALCKLDAQTLARDLASGALDLAVMTPATAPDHLRTRTLYEERYVCACRKDHPALDDIGSLATFAALEHIVVSPRGGGFRGPTDDALAAQGLSRRVAASVSDFLLVPEMLARSDRIALLPERLGIDDDRLAFGTPPLAVQGFAIGLVWHDRTTASPLHAWLRDRIVDGVGG